MPDNWFTGNWGLNTALFSYTMSGLNNTPAAKVEMSSWTDGDAKWYFADLPVMPDLVYSFTDQYQSDTTTRVVVRFTLDDGSYLYDDVGTAQPSTDWNTFQGSFYVPVNAESVTVFHLIDSVGYLTIDDASLGIPSYMTAAQVLALQAAGHEIGDHTQTHASLIDIPANEAQQQIAGARTDLLNMGIYTVNSLAYPYGNYNDSVIQQTQAAGLGSARSVQVGYNLKTTNQYGLLTQSIDATTTLDQVKAWVDTARANKTWLILTFHQVDTSGSTYGTTPGMLQNIVDYLNANNVPVKTVTQGVALMSSP